MPGFITGRDGGHTGKRDPKQGESDGPFFMGREGESTGILPNPGNRTTKVNKRICGSINV